jgi:hypothetical protein
MVDKHWQTGDVVKMGVGKEYVPDRVEIGERQVPNARACVDQHIVINEHGGGSCSRTDSAAAT